MVKKSKNKSFEESLNDLQSIIKELESDSIPLDKMIKLFEEGINLTVFCRKELNDVENKVSTLMKENSDFIEKVGIN